MYACRSPFAGKNPFPAVSAALGGGTAMKVLVTVFFAVASSVAAADSAVDAIAAHKHLGVAACGNSVCHGAAQPFKDSNVLQNEFAVWQEFDPHSKTFTTLSSPAAKSIAAKLGIGDPAAAKVCLDCHVDNQPANLRGERFQLTDGVGCEACHGGAELWLGTHADRKATHAGNLAKGMYATDDPVKRAQLCLSCHVGEKQRMITHRMMGAGHPRLQFELDTFTWLHPHYKIGERWIQRKGEWNGVRDWAVGQGAAAENQLDLLLDPSVGWSGIFPELVLFDCHACHKAYKGNRWGPRQGTGLPPGVVRLNDANLVMFRHVLAPVDRAAAQRIAEETRELHRATLASREATLAVARRLRATLDESMSKVARYNYDAASLEIVLASIEADGKRGEFRDYGNAEQAAFAMQSIVAAFEREGGFDEAKIASIKSRVDALYETVKDEDRFSMPKFVAAMKNLVSAAAAGRSG